MPTDSLTTYRLTLEYEGTDWYGWQIQPDRPTVQQAVQDAIRTVLRLDDVLVVGSGRTDAGVHATGQVAHMVLDNPAGTPSPPIDPFRLRGALNGVLPPTIVVRDLVAAPVGFHARYSATSRRYEYALTSEPIALIRRHVWHIRPAPDVDVMARAARDLLGTHDFTSFCRTQAETPNRTCTILKAAFRQEPRHGLWTFSIEADRFLHGMVRTIVGTLVDIGQGRLPTDSIPRILARQDRRAASRSAPAHGLTLVSVLYPPTPEGAPCIKRSNTATHR
ncbi:MAG: tRNA pseudouridine(38-40) synthase TruA [Bacteroidetes bacterium CG12_big_fil_rev_8_21_14_0_65_60_17]|nr:MAG: tRNA pseudouridine(38-40) synthase TruA [Bacteroidetes bacterium CG12_big_fil_rev_8_21_14_0_65_60_17]